MSFFRREHVSKERVWVLPPLYPAAALVSAWFVQDLIPLPPLAAGWMGIPFLLAGAALMVWALAWQIRNKTSPNPWDTTTNLVTDGPYAFSRNPVYLSDLLLQTGLSLLLGWTWGILLLPFTWACLRFFVIAKEERFLAEYFQEPYTAYLGKVRRWL